MYFPLVDELPQVRLPSRTRDSIPHAREILASLAFREPADGVVDEGLKGNLPAYFHL